MTIVTPESGTVISYQTHAVGDGSTYKGTVVASDVTYAIAKSFYDVDAYRARVIANGHSEISKAEDAKYILMTPASSVTPIAVSLDWINESTYEVIDQNMVIVVKVGFTNGDSAAVLNAIRGLGYSAALVT